MLKVDRHVLATKRIPPTIPFLIPIDETFDVGVDTRTSVNPNDYRVPFPFNGKIEKLTFKLEPIELTEEAKRQSVEAMCKPE